MPLEVAVEHDGAVESAAPSAGSEHPTARIGPRRRVTSSSHKGPGSTPRTSPSSHRSDTIARGVVPRPRIGVMSTGDEVAGTSGTSSIRDANRPGLLALVQAGGAIPVDLGVAGDDPRGTVSPCRASRRRVRRGDHDRRCQRRRSRPRQTTSSPTSPTLDGRNRTLDAGGRTTGQAADVRHDSAVCPSSGSPGTRPARSSATTSSPARPSTASPATGSPQRGARSPPRQRPRSGADRTGDSTSSRSSPRSSPGTLSIRPVGGRGAHHLAATAAANAYAYLPDGPTLQEGTHRRLRLDSRTPPRSLMRRTVAEDP